MAKDYQIPFQDLTNLIPKNLRDPMITSLVDNLFNRFLTHDESVPLYGYVGRKPSSTDDFTQKVPQQTVERDVNALIPVLSFKAGAETFSFTPQDLIRKAQVLGISADQSSWLYSQGNNYVPPIDIDKFTNFFNYFWVARAIPEPATLSWNPSNFAEYYTIARPTLSDLDKINVQAATTATTVLTGTGFRPLRWTVEFTSATEYTVTAINQITNAPAAFANNTQSSSVGSVGLPDLMAPPTTAPFPSVQTPVSFVVNGQPILFFNITRDMVFDGTGVPIGYESFQAGDVFTITAPFLSSTYSVSFIGSAGQKGKLTAVNSLDTYQTVDGVLLKENDRVLVKNQVLLSENGIYIVRPGDWIRAADFDGTTAVAGAIVFVAGGGQADSTWISDSALPTGFSWAIGTSTVSNTNDWQEGNYWVKGEDLAAVGANPALVIQATRPIIEFKTGLQLNTRVSAGVPVGIGGFEYAQRKTEFNQTPQFDLFRYDGTHAGAVSPIFFYEEDPTAAIDSILQRRVKLSTNSSADYLFNHGLQQDNQLLFYKQNGNLKTIWHAGYSAPTVVGGVGGTNVFQANGTGAGTVTIDTAGTDPFSAQQVWTMIATTPTEFSVFGSKTQVLPAPVDFADVGVQYDNGLFRAMIIADPLAPFIPGDTFVFRIGNLETTRYVYRDANDSLYDFFGGPTADLDNVGAWQVPRMFLHNVAADNGDAISEGTLYSHFRGILVNQVDENIDLAFGGSIKLWSEQQNLLASLLMQRDMTPSSIINMAKHQYENAIGSVTDLYFREIVKYIGNVEAATTPIDVIELLDYILDLHRQTQIAKTVLFDSTSPVPGFPATLPQLGVLPLTVPGAYFDNELGVTLLKSHDGHASPIFENTLAFRDQLISSSTTVLRSNGVRTPAIAGTTNTPPANPYKGSVWQRTSNGVTTFEIWDVRGDTNIAPTPTGAGDFWYDRAANTLYEWDGTVWVVETDLMLPWVSWDPAQLLNDMLFALELRLYRGINPNHRVRFTAEDAATALQSNFAPQLQRELNSWAVQNGYDPTAPDYVSTNAFTWNYSGLPVSLAAAVSTSSVPARWWKFLQAHQASIPGVIPTSRPNLEPWKLLGNAEKPLTWDTQYANTVNQDDIAGLPVIDVDFVLFNETAQTTPTTGLPPIPGVQSGDRVLLVSELVSQVNGVWTVSTGWWTGPDPYTNVVINVERGELSGTQWIIDAIPVLPADPVQFTQVRDWTRAMWAFIQSTHPTLKLSVDVDRELLLPPYVNSSLPSSQNALTTSIPPSPAKSYLFGEGSPVETVWTKSIEYGYSLADALFRASPLDFLGHLWGFGWVEVDGILYDGFDMSVPGHPRFRLHGENISAIQRTLPITYNPASVIVDDITLTYNGYTAARKQSFMVRSNGTVLGYVEEGSVAATVAGLADIVIEDEGKPFRIGDTFKITSTGVTFEPATYAQFLGFGQTFAQALRELGVDSTRGYAINAYRGWDVNLGYRAGGLVSTEDLRVFTESTTLPDNSYQLRFKRSEYARNTWVQGLRVTVVQVGAGSANAQGAAVPAGTADDWTFRVEGYNSRYLGIEYHTYDQLGAFETFNALTQTNTTLAWKHRSDVNGTVNAQLPLTITGLQNVIDFLFGYVQVLEEDGWKFNDDGIQNIDAETGRVRNWQLEIEKLVDRVYNGLNFGEGHILNPFIDRIWLQHDTGLLSRFYDNSLFDVNGNPGVFDAIGVKINTGDLTILRGREKSMISAAVPMFSVHAQIDEYEHLFVFNNMAQPSINEGLIYDPFSGARIVTVKLNGRKQAANTLRPEFGGHFLVGDEVRRNLQSSADKIATYYDADSVFEDQQSTKHALALLGFSKKGYMANLDLTERSEFNFWRGMIQMKGTNASIGAFLNNDRFIDAKIDEFWAYKVAEYGDARSKIFPELKLNTRDTLQQFTKLIFDPVSDPLSTPGYEAFEVVKAGDENRWFTLDDLNGETSFESKLVGSVNVTLPVGQYVIPFIADRLDIAGAGYAQLNAKTLNITVAGKFNIVGYGPSTPKFNPVKLLNYVNPQVVEEIPFWHPAIEQHTPNALEGVNIISALDPARYNVSTLVAGNSNFDPLRVWGSKEVGRVWWDVTNLDYTPYYDQIIYPAVDDRLSRWGTLADYATVDVVEWVESTVPPDEYDAQARIDAGDADLGSNTKADGEVYGAKTFLRSRNWMTRAVAWSRAGVATSAAHPSFNGYTGTLRFTGGLAVLDEGTFENRGIVTGMRIGAWQQDANATRPLSEYEILDPVKLVTNTNNLSAPFSVFTGVTATVPGMTALVNVVSTKYTNKVGVLSFVDEGTIATQLRDADGLLLNDWDVETFVKVSGSGGSEVILIRNDRGTGLVGPLHSAVFDSFVGQTFSFAIPSFGLNVSINVTACTNPVPTNALMQLIVGALGSKLKLFDAAQIRMVAALSDPDELVVNTDSFTNDNPGTNAFDPDDFNLWVENNGVGWRAWAVPTQAELDADSRVPNSRWFPYVGEFAALNPVTADTIQSATSGAANYTLNNGVLIERYKTGWNEWEEIVGSKNRLTAAVSGPLAFALEPGTNSSRVSVYVNGVAQLTGTYTIAGNILTVLNVPQGNQVDVLVRAFAPSIEELAFNPDVEDDLLIQEQYKSDYQYVSIPVRDRDGMIASTKYFFWVKNRSTAARNKNLSVKSITQLLKEGPEQFLTFQHITGASPYFYDAIAISGLSYVVTKDDTFKLRFTRNFTLRDDPEGLDLKDTHTEWSLIRPGQRVRVPEKLWRLMTNTACAADEAGNVLPSALRVSYDERNGKSTSFGFGEGQVLAPTELVLSTLLFTVLNTKLVDDSAVVPIPDYMSFLDFNQSDVWFSTPANTRNTLIRIWNEAKVEQINELFFAVIEDIAASNYEMTDLFKTSRLSAYSIKIVSSTAAAQSYE